MKKKDHQDVQDLNKSLYYKKTEFKNRNRRKIHGRDLDLKHDFDDVSLEEQMRQKNKRVLPQSFFKKMFVTALLIFIGAIIFAGVSLFEGDKKVSDKLITLDVIAQPFVDGGEELPLEVRIQNFNEKNLELPDLVLTYKKDSSENASQVALRRSLGDILAGERSVENYDLVLFGQEGDLRSVSARLEYRIEGSSAIFVKEKVHDIVIRSTPTQLTVKAPDSVVRNQEIEFSLELVSNSGKRLRNILLDLDFPRDFELIETSRPSDYSDDRWYFKELDDEVETLTFKGRMSSFEGQSQSFKFRLGKQDPENKQNIETVFNYYSHSVKTERSFLDSRIFVGNNQDSVISIKGGGDISGTVEFENTLDVPLQDVQIALELSGALYDETKIRATNGFYNSNLNAILWDKTNLDDFALFEPGKRGSVFFDIGTRDLAGSAGVIQSPSMEFSVNVRGKTSNGEILEAKKVATLFVQANSDLNILANTQHENGVFKNFGPVPPRVSKTTSYTLNLQLTNSSNELENSFVVFELPAYVKWLDIVSPTRERENVTFNEQSRQVTWKVGKLASGTGFGTLSPRELSMQVEIQPSISQKGQKVDLTRNIYLNGVDTFTGDSLSFKKFPLSTILQNEDETDGRVK